MKTLKKMKTRLLIFGCGTLMMALGSCSKDSPLNPAGNCFDGNWAEQYTSQFQVWTTALRAYDENPTAANCASSKKAGRAYIDAVEDLYECIPFASREEIDQELKDAKVEIENESCDGD